MLTSSIMATSRLLRPNIPRLTQLTQQGRTLSTFTDGERYWKDTPWRNVPAEEFNSYRFQVFIRAKLLTNLARLMNNSSLVK